MRRGVAWAAWAVAAGAVAGGSACCGKRPGDGARPALPDYEAIRAVYNERTGKLERVWGRAVVSLRWTSDEGARRYEQGDGHLQVIRPDRFALSVGKFGEVLYWMGSAGERYWFIDRNDGRHAFVGSHEAIASLRHSPLPAGPRELLVLAGVTPLPATDDADVARGPGGTVVVEPRTPTGARYRYTLDPSLHLPSRITLLDRRGQALIDAEINDFGVLDVTGSGDDPFMASNVRITHVPTDGVMQLRLENLQDRTRVGPIAESSFDFGWLVDRLGPVEVVDVDEALREREGSLN